MKEKDVKFFPRLVKALLGCCLGIIFLQIFHYISLCISYTRFNKTKYVSGNSRYNDNTKMDRRVFETMARLKYCGMTPTSQNYSCDAIKSRIIEEDASYHSIRNFLSSCLLLPKLYRLKYTKP
jgi:hypothetical protein